ncbi:histidine kinase-, DNA gyrase B-, and HSP90-like ATPase family protein [Tasmannia lanceolata]|uniref:histidine kinase-, DNA gyrase B-, and HSP90-like ATPase family protein n=1 Tax=Tasmannia lanceolata TaxID=3420 RepID=UPI004063D792
MYGQPHHAGPRSGAWGPAPPPHPSFFPQNPNPYFQNPNPHFQIPNPNFEIPNPYFQNPNSFLDNHNLLHPQSFSHAPFQPHHPSPIPDEILEKMERAAAKAHHDLLAAGETVSAWKVSQSALQLIQLDSWTSLGFQFQDVPTLRRLMIIEEKINAFIHCFVGVRKITSLYDLDVKICKNESVETFEELGLGPLLRHPLVEHYFWIPPGTMEIVKITTEEIISFLAEFMGTCTAKDIQTERFLGFLAMKRSVEVREKLGVRIQSLGMHITAIREARKAEKASLEKYLQAFEKSEMATIKKYLEASKQASGTKSRKQVLEGRFKPISERVKSLTALKGFGSKHITFISSSSEDENGEEDGDSDDDSNSNCRNSPESRKMSDQPVSSCPYPSVNEEMLRLGLKVETDTQPSPTSGISKCEKGKKSHEKKRKCENQNINGSSSCKLPKMVAHLCQKGNQEFNRKPKKKSAQGKDLQSQHADTGSISSRVDRRQPGHDDQGNLMLTSDTIEMFVSTWKEICRENPIGEVFSRMLNFYSTRQRKKMQAIFSSYPAVGLLNVAVTSMKHGMWDSLYDAFQTIGEHGFRGTNSAVEMIDIGPSIKRDAVSNDCERIPRHRHGEPCLPQKLGVTVDDIIMKVATYIELDHAMPKEGKLHLEKQFCSFRRFHDCEAWLKKQFSVKDFSSLGYGDFFEFLENHISLIPYELLKALTGNLCDKSPMEVSMVQDQLLVLLSQAVNELLDNVVLTKENICMLLEKQFPLTSFQVTGKVPKGNFLSHIRKQKNSDISSCVLFSIPLLGASCIGSALVPNDKHRSEIAEISELGQRAGCLGSVSRKDAIECLLKVPMLSDLLSWTHWDLVFAPSLGPLLEWLLKEAHTKELSCIATRDGKIIRVDHSATVDEFLEASLQGSSFETAAKLLSLLSLYGGTKHVPLSLLKCYAQQAIEVIIRNSIDCIEVKDNGDSFMDVTICNELSASYCRTNKAVGLASSFILDCIAYLPSEFRSFAADVLLSGFKSFTKDAPTVILHECNQTDRRLMLHDIGLSLGILEWIEDYREFSSTTGANFSDSIGTLSKTSKTLSPAFSIDSRHTPDASHTLLSTDGKIMVNAEAHPRQLDRHCEAITEVNKREVLNELSSERFDGDCSPLLSKDSRERAAALIIESIRCEEFGLDPNLKFAESSLLKKQHARLGRALHCLSQELYSLDSHFLLELVQNADDNNYAENVEPTLVFILHATGITVLNNEEGFSAQNIRALCDVGNSTKKGSAAGYIGQKGIGFKSVFRVTDAPEIHSNGFHVKFDISEGQIGFVLPTLTPPCDISLFLRQLSGQVIPTETTCWNTCIVLPFRSKLKEGMGMSSIISMFSDLHPSLLLFLHRLQCIKFRNMLNDSLIIIRRETTGDGIVKVSHGKEKMSWLVASQKLQASTIRAHVQTTEIAIAFTLQESNDVYKPHLQQQPVFAFLPLRTYGLKFILQGDFVLPSSREEVDGDSAWNQWLLSEFPALFVSAETSFCALTCFRDTPGKAVTAYMSFVPLVGEVHGFFAHIPRMIISKLRMANCLLLEGHNMEWVPPCRVLRGWDEKAHSLLPESLLHQHLGLGYLNKDIVLSDPLAMALGVRDYGPEILTEIIESICHTDNGIKSLGLDWLSSWIIALYNTLSVRTQASLHTGLECDLISRLRKIPFIPLSDGSFGSLDEGPIWVPCEAITVGYEGEYSSKDFPSLYTELRMVSPLLLCAETLNTYRMEESRIDTLRRMLLRIGVQQLSAHEVIKTHILPAMSDGTTTNKDKNMMTEYLSFIMLHLQSTCPSCQIEKADIISELQKKAVVLTNHGYKRPFEESIHFSREFGNPVEINKLISNKDAVWNEVDIIYLKHPSTQSLSSGLMKWREFFQELGVTDFVQVVHVEKIVTDACNTVCQTIILDEDLNSSGLIFKDWESPELIHLLSILTSEKCLGSCKYLLEVLDRMWDEFFSARATSYHISKSTEFSKPFESSFMKSIRNFRWIVSSMDEDLHYPRDLFYNCKDVRSILGASASYAVPQVKSEKFLKDIGFKTQVSLDDALRILQYWKTSEAPFRASIAQMSKFYTLIWNGIATSKEKRAEEFRSGPFIFVPLAHMSGHADVVSGVFLPPEEVYWHDPTGCVDMAKDVILQCSSINEISSPSSKTLAHVYPSLHDFFVTECGVRKIPPFLSYFQMLLQLSSIALPSQAAYVVFRVLLRWADDLKSGLVESREISHLKECLLKQENTVLPTVHDKWVSLHPSFGLVCWSDDEDLRKQFKYSNNIYFLQFGNLSDEEKEMISTKFPALMQTIGVPALSKVISREAIFYGTEDSREKASLVDWVLPYAQRYIYKLHPSIHSHIKLFGYESLSQLQVVVVEKLFYKHTIKGCDSASKNRTECNCLLQGNKLYVARASDPHSVFLELSRLFFNGSPELHFANFLHIITTMAESGSTEGQMEFFIVNSQNVPKLPDGEPLWSLPCLTQLHEDETSQPSFAFPMASEQTPKKFHRKPGINSACRPADWETAPDSRFARANYYLTNPAAPPDGGYHNESSWYHNESYRPADWETAPDSRFARANYYLTNPAAPPDGGYHNESSWYHNESYQPEGNVHTEDWPVPTEIYGDLITPNDSATPKASVSKDLRTTKDEPSNRTGPHPPFFTTREQLCSGMPSQDQAFRTGRLGELVAYKYFVEKHGRGAVKWINEEIETGLPYDVVIGEKEGSKEYIEVKATKSMNKDWFLITTREWQFATERGDSFSIAHVVLADPKNAKISVFKNPLKLCRQSMLNLAVLMSK